jgi:hypothetical protein
MLAFTLDAINRSTEIVATAYLISLHFGDVDWMSGGLPVSP